MAIPPYRSQESKASLKAVDPPVATEYKSPIMLPGADRLWSIQHENCYKKMII